jgi:hypothetical protein
MNNTKDVTIGGVRYQISKLPVFTSVWMATVIATKFLPPGMEGMLGLPALSRDRTPLSEEEFTDLASYCIMAAKKYQVEPSNNVEYATPLMVTRGIWAFPDMQYDPVAVIGLVVAVMEFNVTAFFAEKVLKELKESFQGITLFSTKA